MLNFDEYKKLMKCVYKEEKQRWNEVKKIKRELNELGKTGKISDQKKFTELICKLSALASVYFDDF